MTARPTLPPGPSGLPLLGNLFDIAPRDILGFWQGQWVRFGDVSMIRAGPLPIVLITHPNAMEHVLLRHADRYSKGLMYRHLRLLLGRGLLTSESPQWEGQRKLLQPGFGAAASAQYLAPMLEACTDLIQRWRPIADQQGSVDIEDEMMRLTLDIIARSLFGRRMAAADSTLRALLDEAFAYITDRTQRPLMPPLILPTRRNLAFRRCRAALVRKVQELAQDTGETAHTSPVLSALSDSAPEDRFDEILTLIFAGYETTARTLAWVWALLADHPDQSRALVADLDALDWTGPPEIGDIMSLRAVHCVLSETLRLVPPTGFIGRQARVADTIGGFHIPKRAVIVLGIHFLHRHPGVWPNPDQFDPNRFAKGPSNLPHPFAYIPFSKGYRACLGQHFAVLEMSVAIAMIARQFTLGAGDGPKAEPYFHGTTRFRHPVTLTLRNRL